MPGSIRAEVKSAAGAIRAIALIRSGRACATRQAIQPPIEDPTSTNGPSVRRSITARASSRQRPMVPSANRPSLSPWPK